MLKSNTFSLFGMVMATLCLIPMTMVEGGGGHTEEAPGVTGRLFGVTETDSTGKKIGKIALGIFSLGALAGVVGLIGGYTGAKGRQFAERGGQGGNNDEDTMSTAEAGRRGGQAGGGAGGRQRAA